MHSSIADILGTDIFSPLQTYNNKDILSNLYILLFSIHFYRKHLEFLTFDILVGMKAIVT